MRCCLWNLSGASRLAFPPDLGYTANRKTESEVVSMCTRNQAFEILKIVYHACDPILGHSIHDAILYGSYARGDFTAESDIDILLTADLTQEQIASQQRAVSGVASALSLDCDVTVSVHVVPLAQFRRYADFLPFYQNVLKEGIRYAS